LARWRILITVKLTDVDLPAPLLTRAREGDPLALEAFYRACARPACTLARRIVGPAAADDVVQDAFLDAFRGLPAYDARAPLGAWFRAIVLRRCLMHLRSPWRRARERLDDWLDTLEARGPAGAAGEALDLGRALDRLPATTRAVVWLYDVEGCTHEEIAAAFGRTPSFSKSQLARGRARLRGWLDAETDGGATTEEVKGACERATPN
jgi:RNA polymerase sigma-70 factor (ECF subfamily)